MKRILLAVDVLLILGVAACGPVSSPGASSSPASSSILPLLGSAEYPLDLSPTGNVRLADGKYQGEPLPNSATRLQVSMWEPIAEGDLNGDGLDDAAVVLAADPGGSGTFLYLFAVLNAQGRARPIAPAFLGDRVVVQSLSIEGGEIHATVLERGPNEPLSSPPTIPKPYRFRLMDGTLEAFNQP